MKGRKQFVAFATLAVLVCVSGCGKDGNVQIYDGAFGVESESMTLSGRDGMAGDRQETEAELSLKETENSMLYVYVCGAVEHPGVVTLPAGSRVFEAIEKAGGLAGEAAGFAVNQAAALEDGQQITVPTKEEAAGWEPGRDAQTAGLEESAEEEIININEAAAEELTALPGIGKAKAESIVEYRKSAGRFGSIEEIKNVSGIGDAVFEKIKDKIAV